MAAMQSDDQQVYLMIANEPDNAIDRFAIH